MKIEQVLKCTKATAVCGKTTDKDVESGFCSDLMSDVLTIDSDHLLLITGLANVQTVRTAEMADVNAILLVRGKKASTEMLELANETGIVIMESSISMFHAAGILYAEGLKVVY